MPRTRQIAAIPVRRNARGKVQVLLVTSRETQRWVIPKGWPWPDLPDHEAAAEEAWEEAGVRGLARRNKIGSFTYDKRRNGKVVRVLVVVYLLEVREMARTWPECAERRRAWFSPAKAANAVEELKLKTLLHTLDT
ncbi:MAG TPA: NUDIX domain-containing protein [Hyphomicrobiaceae bacterium]|nr:NUDIX domain-containing protein [Hyphomicrobiaceae bacterium]